MATEGEEGDKAPVRPAGKSRFKRFRDSAELAILLASLVLAGVSVYQSRQAGAAADAAVEAAEDANAAAREANGNEFSNAALERTTIEACRLKVWSTHDDGTVGSTSVACTEPVSVAPGDVLWVSAGIPEGQKKTFCTRHPSGTAGFKITVRHALYNVSNALPEADPPVALSLSCEHHIFPEPP